MAILNAHITADVVEVNEFMDMARRYSIRGVPKTVINDSVEFVGNVPEEDFVEAIRSALEPAGA